MIKRGDIWLVDYDPVKGSEIGKARPSIIVQNDVGNRFSNTTIVVPITGRISEKDYPTDVFISAKGTGLQKDGSVNCAQIATVSVQDRVIKRLGSVDWETMVKIDEALKASLALD